MLVLMPIFPQVCCGVLSTSNVRILEFVYYLRVRFKSNVDLLNNPLLVALFEPQFRVTSWHFGIPQNAVLIF